MKYECGCPVKTKRTIDEETGAIVVSDFQLSCPEHDKPVDPTEDLLEMIDGILFDKKNPQ